MAGGLPGQLGTGTFAIYVMDFGAPAGFRLAPRHPERLSAIIAQNAPLYPEQPRGWWATLGQLDAMLFVCALSQTWVGPG